MKKIIAAVLISMMALSMAACGAKKSEPAQTQAPEETQVQTETAAAETSDAEESEAEPAAALDTKIVQEYASLEELTEAFSCTMVKPEGAEITEEKFLAVEENGFSIAEYDFLADGKKGIYRFCKEAGMDADISGYINSDGKTAFNETFANHAYFEDDISKHVRWFTVDGQYVFGIVDDSEWDWNKFDEMTRELPNIKPVGWDDTYDFDFYQSVCGNYNGEREGVDYVAASISIVGNDLETALLHSFDDEDNTRLLWTFGGGKYTDGVIAYDTEKLEKYTYNESTGQSTQEVVREAGGGTIELQDTTLIFSGVNDEECKGDEVWKYTE